MQEFAILWDWISFAVRWLHVITAIAWIGSSFYFIALDLGLRKPPDLPDDVHGEEWQVHGGGFYHIRKYLVAPQQLPEHLTWFKWESYATWLSGVALLMIIYWVGGDLYLIDPGKADLDLWQGILISAASLAAGWLIYDFLCRSGIGAYPTLLMVLLFFLLIAVSWGYSQVFTGRAALLHLGAFTATVMTANVFFVIIPGQRTVVDALRNGRRPDPEYGKAAKLRSTHNNYLTLPVLFLMLSNHFPLSFATEYSWVIACLVFLMGVTIRHYFNTMHSRSGKPTWTWAVTAILFILIAWLSTAPMPDSYRDAESRQMTPSELRFASADGFDRAYEIVLGNCSMCHAREPVWEGIRWPPKGVVLETPSDVARHADAVFLHAGVSHAMPPPGAFSMDSELRAALVAWHRSARGG